MSGRSSSVSLEVVRVPRHTRAGAQGRRVKKKTKRKPPPLPLPPYSHKEIKDAKIALRRHPLGHLLIEKMLLEEGFRGGISSDKHLLERYATDESIFSIRPQVIIQPKNKQDVEIAVRVVARETKRFSSLSLTPRAAGTGLSGGSLTDSMVIDVCAHLHHIGEVVERRDKITITCEPGAMWRDVEKRLKRHHAYLPPYPASKDICSVGGSVANNAAGPDSLRYGHCADWVESMDVVLADGRTYTIKPLTYKELKSLTKQKHEYARIVKEVFALVETNEEEIRRGRPPTKKNTAGYSLWHVCPDGIEAFKKGKGVFDLTRLISGSQGTIGIIVSLTLRALPIPAGTALIAVPIFDLKDAASVINNALVYEPLDLEVFDALGFDLALKNPSFFKSRLGGLSYYRTMLAMYAMYHVRYARRLPEITVLMTVDGETLRSHTPAEIVTRVSSGSARARLVTNSSEVEALWQIRRSSYLLSKLQNQKLRPAAFLEDMVVPTEHISKFFIEIRRLLREFNVDAVVHGHGGDGHLHFYPLLDFTKTTTPLLIERMADRFFQIALKYKGNICGEHNDGIIRTPHLSKIFSPEMLELFKRVERIFDPDDIFNPGKKVNPRFDIKRSIRTTN